MKYVEECNGIGSHLLRRVDLYDANDVATLLLAVKRGLNTLEPKPPALIKLHDDLVKALS